jgi:hypothetical protein
VAKAAPGDGEDDEAGELRAEEVEEKAGDGGEHDEESEEGCEEGGERR